MGKGKVGFEKFVEITMKIAAILVVAAGLINLQYKKKVCRYVGRKR